MPQLENVSTDGHVYSLRLIGPASLVWPNPPVNVQTYAVLGQPNMVARPISISNIPGSPDFVSGSWTGRIDDAGEMSLTFPSGLQQPSDGPPWQTRFDPGVNGLWNEWIEIYRDGELEGVFNVNVTALSRGFVQVTGFDGSYALKNAYERDWTVVMAPRDVIERGTQVWVPVTTDNFPAGSLSAQWTPGTQFGGTVSIGASGGLVLATPATSNAFAAINSPRVTVAASTQAWSATALVQYSGLGTATDLSLYINESTGDQYTVSLQSGLALFYFGGVRMGQTQIQSAASYGLLLESDGEWVWAFCNGQLIGCIRRNSPSTTSLGTGVLLDNGTAVASTATVTGVLTKALQPWLM